MSLRAGVLTVGFVVIFPSPALPCSTVSGTPVTWTRDAEVILRVRALGQRDISPAPSRWPASAVRFEVVEVIKGSRPGGTVEVQGSLVDRDDPNDRPVPYDLVRPEGTAGNCFAMTYKKGGEYLLMLRPVKGTLTPYWASMGATNEQLFGANDKWLAWVRQELKRLPSAVHHFGMGLTATASRSRRGHRWASGNRTTGRGRRVGVRSCPAEAIGSRSRRCRCRFSGGRA